MLAATQLAAALWVGPFRAKLMRTRSAVGRDLICRPAAAESRERLKIGDAASQAQQQLESGGRTEEGMNMVSTMREAINVHICSFIDANR